MKKILDWILNLKENQITSNQFLDYIVSPVSPYLLCAHYISVEFDEKYYHRVNCKLNMNSNNLLKNENFDTINNYDIVQVQNNKLKYFYINVLPILKNKNIKIILFTSQEHISALTKNKITDAILNSDNILFWISTYPVYEDNDKFLSFPIGIHQHKVQDYVQFLKNEQILKKNKILNLYCGVHKHLPENHIRKKYKIFGEQSGKKLPYEEFLKNVSSTEFLISTTGDRDDCYRHYECIGLNTIPISNISNKYKSIFKNDMVYSNANEMIKMLETKNVDIMYKETNRDIITIEYWKKIILDKKNKMIELQTKK